MGSVVEEVIARVVGLEDISADSALALINILNLLKDFVPSLFKVRCRVVDDFSLFEWDCWH